MNILLFTAIVASVTYCVNGHGMVLDPLNRASRWREDETAPQNYDDNGLFCGGRVVQWEQNGGKCGLCGDNYADPKPRKYELGGSFGQGTIVKSYKSGDEMYVQVLVTANHLGFFSFKLCNLDRYQVESEECYDDIVLLQTNGENKFIIDERTGYFDVMLKIPAGLVCEHCILQWTWTTGNSWGQCDERNGQIGCGEQETFRTCSDISILP